MSYYDRKLETLDASALRAYQEKRLRRLMAALPRSAFYRRKLATAGLQADRASLCLPAGPVLTRVRSRLRKFDTRSHWGTTSDTHDAPTLVALRGSRSQVTTTGHEG